MKAPRFGFALAFLLASGVALAGRINDSAPSGGGGSTFTGGNVTSDITVQTAGATTRGSLGADAGTAATWWLKATSGTYSMIRLTQELILGRQGDVAVGSVVACISDGLTVTGDGTPLGCMRGGGLFAHYNQHTIAEAAATLNQTAPTSTSVKFNCTSGTVCNYEPGESGILQGSWFDMINTGSASVVVTTAAGVVVVRGSPLTVAAGEMMHCMYSGSAWACQ
jgi:hypothetical protein